VYAAEGTFAETRSLVRDLAQAVMVSEAVAVGSPLIGDTADFICDLLADAIVSGRPWPGQRSSPRR
jgi:hypothetical protein